MGEGRRLSRLRRAGYGHKVVTPTETCENVFGDGMGSILEQFGKRAGSMRCATS